jgi:hypothetical protein
VVVCLERGAGDGSWPPGIDMQLLVSNNLELLQLRVGVVSVKEKPITIGM